MIALVPLDNRPCNYRFPQQIAAIGGQEMLLPPDEWLGDLHTPGRSGAVRDWLLKLPEVESLIVSIDMLAYGGLVFSRRVATPPEDALELLQALKTFRTQRPSTPILAFNILMRLAITMDSEAAAPNYYNVMRYARLADEAERFDSAYLREQLQQVKEEIPPAVLGEYLAARQRNHTVNLQMIDWLGEGVFDYLLITQEDAAEFGLHRREQDALLAHAEENSSDNKMSLHPGADEASLTLLARQWNTKVKFRAHWSNLEDARHIAPFEDRPFEDALHQHVAAMNGVLLSDGLKNEDADFELFINAPVGGWNKEEEPEQKQKREARLQSFARELESALKAGRRVALCDVGFPNGADDLLMSQLDRRGLLGQLSAFGGWNTAGNTLGTVLAQCAALQNAESAARGEDSVAANRQFVFERLVDDWFYQSRVRSRIEKTAREMGASPLDLNGGGGAVETQARRELRGYAQLLAQRHFHSALGRCEVTLPWRRTFEVDLRAELAPREVSEN